MPAVSIPGEVGTQPREPGVQKLSTARPSGPRAWKSEDAESRHTRSVLLGLRHLALGVQLRVWGSRNILLPASAELR